MQSSSQIVTNTPTPSFLYRPDSLPVAEPSVRALKGNQNTTHSVNIITSSVASITSTTSYNITHSIISDPGLLGNVR